MSHCLRPFDFSALNRMPSGVRDSPTDASRMARPRRPGAAFERFAAIQAIDKCRRPSYEIRGTRVSFDRSSRNHVPPPCNSDSGGAFVIRSGF